MKMHFFTIVLDGMPFITCHLPRFNRLQFDWHWHVVEGVASATHCTAWCNLIRPRLSIDGTSEYLDSIKDHPKVTIYRREQWDGKIEMVNAPLQNINEECLLMQIDSDEIWTSDQIATVRYVMLSRIGATAAMFRCRYFVGQNIIITSDNTYGNHLSYEWKRVWKFKPGMRFEKHEPPLLPGAEDVIIDQNETDIAGLVFDHYAYALEKQVEFKERYYGYKGAVRAWRALQQNKTWPAKLADFLPWVKDDATVSTL